MKMLLTRGACATNSTPGHLYIDGKFECHTLEDIVRAEKIAGCTAIPAGTYKVYIDMSTRFKCLMPIIWGVQGFEGVRIHAGNTSEDTEGCILVGDLPAHDYLGKSRVAYERLFAKLSAAVKNNDPITLEIK